MTGQTLLDKLNKAGCRVTLDGEQLRVSGRLTDGLRALIREHKAETVQYLKRREFVQDVCRQLDSHGIARFFSERLQEQVYIVRDWDTLLSLPKDALVFSLTELTNMMTQSYTDDELRELAQVKKELLAEHRQHLAVKQKAAPTGVQAALRAFPGSRVVDLDAAAPVNTEPAPAEPAACYVCRSNDWWTQPTGSRACRICHPPPAAAPAVAAS